MALVAGAAERLGGPGAAEKANLPSHSDFYGIASILLFVFAALVGPELLCRDRRDRVLTLYLVRPITGTDYVAARWAAFMAVMTAAAWLPQVILFIGLSMGNADPAAYLQQHWLDIPRFLLAGAALAAYATTLAMLTASFTTRRAYASVFLVGLFVISTPFTDRPRLRHRRNGRPVDLDVQPHQHPGPRERRDLRRRQPRDERRPRARARPRHPRRLVLRLDARARCAALVALPEDVGMSAQPTPVIRVNGVSRWFGSVVAVSDVSFDIAPGITGLLGPNGAGKTTLLRMMTGLAATSTGTVTMFGEPVRDNPPLYRRIGVMSEHETVYGFMTGREFVRMMGRLREVPDLEAAVDRAIALVDLADAQHRPMDGYSRGMRQRMRLAATLVHDPEILILDEPLNGADPRQRVHFTHLLQRLAAEGRTIVLSSHILEEVEQVADTVLLIVNGKLAASGGFRAIRAALDQRPYHVRVHCNAPRQLAVGRSRARLGGRGAPRPRRRHRDPEPQRPLAAARAAAARPRLIDQPPPRRAARRLAGERVRLPGGAVTWAPSTDSRSAS